MHKTKLLISLGALTTITLPLATAISCSSDNKTYKVLIDNAKDKNYVIATTDINYQPIPYSKKNVIFWDMSLKYKTPQYLSASDAFFQKNQQDLLFAIKEEKIYQNGLEWFIYEILKALDQKIDLELPFNNYQNIPLDSNFVSNKAHANFIELFEKKAQELVSKDKKDNPNSTKTESSILNELALTYDTYVKSKGQTSLGNTWIQIKDNFKINETSLKKIKSFVDAYNNAVQMEDRKINWSFKNEVFVIPKTTMAKNAQARADYLKTHSYEFINAFWNVELVVFNPTTRQFENKVVDKETFDEAVDNMLKAT